MERADARDLPISDGSVGPVLTSPPYLNVRSYGETHGVAMRLLGWDSHASWKAEIGSCRKHRRNKFRGVVQYVIDVAVVLQELFRVAAVGAPALLVFGRESTVSGLRFPNSQLAFGAGGSPRGVGNRGVPSPGIRPPEET